MEFQSLLVNIHKREYCNGACCNKQVDGKSICEFILQSRCQIILLCTNIFKNRSSITQAKKIDAVVKAAEVEKKLDSKSRNIKTRKIET